MTKHSWVEDLMNTSLADEIQMVIDECRRRGGDKPAYGPGNTWLANRLEELQDLKKEKS